MEPLKIPVKVPILTGETKLPDALLNCAVKTFPALKLPEISKGTFVVLPAQALLTAPVEIPFVSVYLAKKIPSP